MATAKNGEPAAARPIPSFLTLEQRDILAKSALCERLDENQKAYFFEVVERTKLDPFTGQIRPDIRKKTEEDGSKTPTLLIIVTLQGLRVIADRTGQLDGEDAPEWCGSDGHWVDVWLADEPPKAARASVHRKDRPRKQTQICRWDAFVQNKWDKSGNAVPNPFWKRMGSHMLSKCALAGAYRGSFPNQCSGLYISEELQDVLDPDSEEAIEAEMIRRARAEKEYWDKEREKGNLPIDEVQRLERQRLAMLQQGTNGPSTIPAPLPPNAVVGGPVLSSPAFPANLPTATASAPPSAPPAPTLPKPKPVAPPPPPPPQDWRTFTIDRIESLAGRTVASLTEGEVRGVRPWLERVEKSWGSLDAGLKAHYLALRERLIWDQSHPQAEETDPAEQMDFSRI